MMMASRGNYSLMWDVNHGGDLIFFTLMEFNFVRSEGREKHMEKFALNLTDPKPKTPCSEGQCLKLHTTRSLNK